MDKNAFKDVIGHEQIIKELMNYISWFEQAEELAKKGIKVPKGILLTGHPGNGKTLLLKSLINSVDIPTVVVKSKSKNVVEDVNECFKKAESYDKAIVVIDEIDLLLERNMSVIRCLQENMDGVLSTNKILVLAASNNPSNIPGPLLRAGRLGKRLYIPALSEENSAKLLIKTLKEDLHATFKEKINLEVIGEILSGTNCARIKEIANSVALRQGVENLTNKKIYTAIAASDFNCQCMDDVPPNQVIIHEASHAVMAYHFKNYYKITKMYLTKNGGFCVNKELNELDLSYTKARAFICIGVAGKVGPEVILKEKHGGSMKDIEDVANQASDMLFSSGFNGVDKALAINPKDIHSLSEHKKKQSEKYIEKEVKQCEKYTRKFLKKNKRAVLALADKLKEKQYLFREEIESIIETNLAK